jgi:hypothetical protein
MRRIGILLAVVVVVVAGLVYLGTRGQTTSAFAVTLTAQQSPALPALKRHWTTTRRLSVTCARPQVVTGSATGSRRALCSAVAYYARHPPKRCVVIGPIVNHHRVLIAGIVGGHKVRLVMGMVCNPPPMLSQAVDTIYTSVFKE